MDKVDDLPLWRQRIVAGALLDQVPESRVSEVRSLLEAIVQEEEARIEALGEPAKTDTDRELAIWLKQSWAGRTPGVREIEVIGHRVLKLSLRDGSNQLINFDSEQEAIEARLRWNLTAYGEFNAAFDAWDKEHPAE